MTWQQVADGEWESGDWRFLIRQYDDNIFVLRDYVEEVYVGWDFATLKEAKQEAERVS